MCVYVCVCTDILRVELLDGISNGDVSVANAANGTKRRQNEGGRAQRASATPKLLSRC